MKKIFIIPLFLLSFSANAREVYFCSEMIGTTTPLTEKSSLWNKFKWLHHGVEETKTVLGEMKIVVDNNNSEIVVNGESTPLTLFNDNDDKAELLEIGKVCSFIHSIDKANKKLLSVKNCIVPTELKSILNITKPYQMMMTAECK